MPPAVRVAAVVKGARPASAGLLADRAFPTGIPGGCIPGALGEGPLAGAALTFSSAWPTLKPEKLPKVSPATEAWLAGSAGLRGRLSGLGVLAKGREVSAACPSLWPGSPEPLLAVAQAPERVGGLGPPKGNEASGAGPNFIPPPREKASGWFGSFAGVAVAAKRITERIKG